MLVVRELGELVDVAATPARWRCGTGARRSGGSRSRSPARARSRRCRRCGRAGRGRARACPAGVATRSATVRPKKPEPTTTRSGLGAGHAWRPTPSRRRVPPDALTSGGRVGRRVSGPHRARAGPASYGAGCADPGVRRSRCAVVVVTYSPGEALERASSTSLAAATTRPVEVVLADNGSTDGAPERAAAAAPARPPAAHRREHRLRRGGRTPALADVATGWALVANPDIRFEPGAVDELLAAADALAAGGHGRPGHPHPGGRALPLGARPAPRCRPASGTRCSAGPGRPTRGRPATGGSARPRASAPPAGCRAPACWSTSRRSARSAASTPATSCTSRTSTSAARLGRRGWLHVYAPSAVVDHEGGHATRREPHRMQRVHHTSALRYLSRRYPRPRGRRRCGRRCGPGSAAGCCSPTSAAASVPVRPPQRSRAAAGPAGPATADDGPMTARRSAVRHAVIMAGGSGTRLWPLSRAGRPKQLLDVVADARRRRAQPARRGLRPAARRCCRPTGSGCAPPPATPSQVRAALPELRAGPAGARAGRPGHRQRRRAGRRARRRRRPRRRAGRGQRRPRHPAGRAVRRRPATPPTRRWPRARARWSPSASRPTSPATGFGYVQRGAATEVPGVVRGGLLPREARPRHRRGSTWRPGEYLWNSGHVRLAGAHGPGRARPSTCRRRAEGLAPDRRRGPGPDRDAVLAEVFPTLPKISVDYAVLEPAAAEPGRVLVADLDVDWLDVGSWPALAHTLAATPTATPSTG